MPENKNTVIIIVGPTASGKTALAIEVAKQLNTSIISADSRQCFKELNIGVAKPTQEELQQIHHYFIDSYSILETVNAQTFEAYSLKAAAEIFTGNKFAVMAGGTGLYIKAFCEGLDEIPIVSNLVREKITKNYQKYGLQWLQDEVKEKDTAYWQTGEQQNPHRLIRALEIIEATGLSITSFRKGEKKQRFFNTIKIGLDIPKEQLHLNINNRVEKMMADGLADEAKSLCKYKHLNALQTVGYKEMFDYLDGKYSLDAAISSIKSNTRKYAKRQLTWFKKDKEINWLQDASKKSVEFILQQYNQV